MAFDWIKGVSEKLNDSDGFKKGWNGSTELDYEAIGIGIKNLFGGGGNKKNTNHDNLNRQDPDVWHNGNPYDGSKSRKHNQPIFDAQKEQIRITNIGLYNAFEKFIALNKRDPKRSEWELFAAPHLQTAQSRKSVPVVPKQAIEKVKQKEPLKAKAMGLKTMVMENKGASIAVGLALGGIVLKGGLSSFVNWIKDMFGGSKKRRPRRR